LSAPTEFEPPFNPALTITALAEPAMAQVPASSPQPLDESVAEGSIRGALSPIPT